ncbi:MAG: leucine-rich repeat domain-containing protein [Bacillota bacterium]
MTSKNYSKVALVSVLILLLFLVGCSEEQDDLAKSTIDVNADGGQVELEPDKSVYKIGEQVTLTASPNDQFTGWVINGETRSESQTTITIQDPVVKVQAGFEQDSSGDDGTDSPDDGSDDSGDEPQAEYSITANSNNSENGEVTITNRDTGEEISNGSSVVEGTAVEVSASAKEDGYQLTEWELNGEKISDDSDTYIIDSLEEDVTITGYFDNKSEVSAEPSGKVSGITVKAYDLTGTELGVLYEDGSSSEITVDTGKEIILTTTGAVDDYGLYNWGINGTKKYEQQLTELGGDQGVKVEVTKSLTGTNQITPVYSPIVLDTSYTADKGTILGAIREGKEKGKIYGPLTEKDLSDVTYLNATGYDISDLGTIVDYLDNLDHLILRRTDVDIDNNDLETISKLTSLKTLELNNPDGEMNIDYIDDFSKLDKLTNLTYLDLRYNNVQNVDFIQNMTKLETLNLIGNDVKLVNPLTKLDNLKTVNLRHNDAVLMTEDSAENVPDTSPVDQAILEDRTGLSFADSNYTDLSAWKQHVETVAGGNNYDLHNEIAGTVYATSYPTLTRSVQGDGEGEIVLSPSPANGKYYYPGSEVTISAQAGPNSSLTSLVVDGNDINSGDTITIDGDTTITAEFAKN